MDCNEARDNIWRGRAGAELADHLEGCAACRQEQALWGLLGEAPALEAGLDLSERVMGRLKDEERRGPWEHLRSLLGLGYTSTRTLDEFSDFPPDSFGALLFGPVRDRSREA